MSRKEETRDKSESQLQGTTLIVYAFVVKKGWPVGTRVLVRVLGLSSSSVAYRHLQKLEALGLISQTENCEYVIQQKMNIQGYFWLGRNLTPRMLIYGLFFQIVLAAEIVIFAMHFAVEDFEFKIFFLLMMTVTAAVSLLLIFEGAETHAILHRMEFDSLC